jgi:tetratricopeptide (TPR) repeat protein
MKFAHQLGLVLLVNLAIVSGGMLPGMAGAIGPVTAPKSGDTAQTVFDEGKKLVSQDVASSRRAIEKFKQSLKLSQQTHNQSLQALSLQWLGIVHYNLDEKPEALAFYNQALPIFHALGDRSSEVSTLQVIGNIYTYLGENQKALKTLKESLALHKAANLAPLDRANILYDVGEAYALLGDRQQALDAFSESLPIWKTSLHEFSIIKYAETLSNIADIYSNLGNKQKALDIYYKILVFYTAPELLDRELPTKLIYSSDAERENLNFLDNSLGVISSNGDADPVNAIGRALVLNKLGRLFLDLGSNKLSIKFFNLAKISQVQGRFLSGNVDLSLAATTLNNLGLAYNGLGETQKALEDFDLALEHRRELRDRHGEAIVLNNKGLVYTKLGNQKKAIALYREALPLSHAVGDRDTEAATLYNIASTDYKQSQLAEALTSINSAINLVELLRSELKNDVFKTAYFTSVQSYYELKKNILMDLHRQQPTQGYDAAALETVDQSRARILRELLIQANANINKDIAPDLLKQEQTLNQAIDAKEKQLVQFSSQPGKEAQLSTLNPEIAALYNQRDELKNRIRTINPAYANLQYPKPITLKQIQQQLDPDTLMLQYSLGDKESYLWVIGNNSLKTSILPKRADIEKTVATFRRELQLPSPASALTLTQQILAPAAAELGNKHLVIIPDGILHTIPFAALSTPNSKTYQPLITQHEITNLPSASTIAILRSTVATKPRAPKQLAILADPIFRKDDPRLTGKTIQPNNNFDLGEQSARGRIGRDLNLDRLPFTATEAQGILKLVPQANDRISAFGFDASYDWITDPKISQYRYVHLATHGFFDNDKWVVPLRKGRRKIACS